MSERPSIKANGSAGGGGSRTDGPDRKVGAIWKRQGKYGEFFTGQIAITDQFKQKLENAPVDKFGNKLVDIVIFANQNKEGDKHPDFKIVLGEPKKPY